MVPSQFLPHPTRILRLTATFVALTAFACVPGLRAQSHPRVITAEESQGGLYVTSGRMLVNFGKREFIGTATMIRRYTALTAGHILFDPDMGFASQLRYEPAYYYGSAAVQRSATFAVLSGYQSASQSDPNGDRAFAQDMGYLLLSTPAYGDRWADWTASPGTLTTTDADLIAFGYAADKLDGEAIAFVQPSLPYFQLSVPTLYENKSFYTEGGMSGGPVYGTVDGKPRVLGVNVAGTDYTDPALSDARVISSSEVSLFTDAEYAQGLVAGGFIKAPPSVAAGGTVKLKTGAIFADGKREKTDLPVRYDELTLVVVGNQSKKVTLTRIKPGKYVATFSSKLKAGATLTFALQRSTLPPTQTPVQTVTVQVR